MKAFFALVLMFASSMSFAADCVSRDGVVIADGTSAVFYHSSNPSREFGPNYKCSYSTSQRVRTCNNGQLSVVPRQCSQYDSGGCVDSWEDMLEDTQFVFARCND